MAHLRIAGMILPAGLLPLVLGLAACGSGLVPLPNNEVRAAFAPGGIADQITVDAVDRLPLRAADLVAPDGHVTPALSLSAKPAPTQTYSQSLPAGPETGPHFGVSSIGSNAFAPGVVGAAPLTQARLLAVVSNAAIQLPDPVAYRRDWQKYRLRLTFGDPPQTETREIAAPAPPPLANQ